MELLNGVIDLDAMRVELDNIAPDDTSGYYVRGRQVVAAKQGQGVTLCIVRVWLDVYGIPCNWPVGPLASARRCYALVQFCHKLRPYRPCGRTAHFKTVGEAIEGMRAAARGESPVSTFEPR